MNNRKNHYQLLSEKDLKMSHQRKNYPVVFEAKPATEKQLTNVKKRQQKRALRGPKVKHYSE